MSLIVKKNKKKHEKTKTNIAFVHFSSFPYLSFCLQIHYTTNALTTVLKMYSCFKARPSNLKLLETVVFNQKFLKQKFFWTSFNHSLFLAIFMVTCDPEQMEQINKLYQVLARNEKLVIHSIVGFGVFIIYIICLNLATVQMATNIHQSFQSVCEQLKEFWICFNFYVLDLFLLKSSNLHSLLVRHCSLATNWTYLLGLLRKFMLLFPLGTHNELCSLDPSSGHKMNILHILKSNSLIAKPFDEHIHVPMGIKPFDLTNDPMAFFSNAKVICINLNLKYNEKKLLLQKDSKQQSVVCVLMRKILFLVFNFKIHQV